MPCLCTKHNCQYLNAHIHIKTNKCSLKEILGHDVKGMFTVRWIMQALKSTVQYSTVH